MDLMPIQIADDQLFVDSGQIVKGLPHGTNVTGLKFSKNSCLGDSSLGASPRLTSPLKTPS